MEDKGRAISAKLDTKFDAEQAGEADPKWRSHSAEQSARDNQVNIEGSKESPRSSRVGQPTPFPLTGALDSLYFETDGSKISGADRMPASSTSGSNFSCSNLASSFIGTAIVDPAPQQERHSSSAVMKHIKTIATLKVLEADIRHPNDLYRNLAAQRIGKKEEDCCLLFRLIR
ncbi:hypothetical protein K2173_007042 [Erythroxylum novogranatense]|uniref:Uncharacterized protein n=1 Tax=Erythroxylum novogranatense TaxID=1862640 RepID=A0AAV8SKF1_9ROSI|nr:hypothetical protein K2173_007042 [Erythroxylum novogranatense]